MLTTLLMAVSIAVDAAAVTAALGALGASWTRLAAASWLFGLFQAGMAAAGAGGGMALAGVGGTWPSIVGAALLVWVGGRMVLHRPENAPDLTELHGIALIGLAVATSVDALAAGVTLPALPHAWPLSVGLIGLVTWAMCMGAAAAGRWMGARIGPTALRLAGVVLLGLAGRALSHAPMA